MHAIQIAARSQSVRRKLERSRPNSSRDKKAPQSVSGIQFSLEYRIELSRIRFAFGCLHNGTDKKTEQFSFAAAVLRDLLLVGRDNLVDQGFYRTDIGNLL